MAENNSVEESIKQVREGSKKNFIQSIDLIVNLKNIDLKKPENKFSKDVVLPHGRGKNIEVGVISDNFPGAITKAYLEGITKIEMRKLVRKYDFFVCEAPLMALVGKVLGKYLGPKGKMPKLLPPHTDPKPMVEELKTSLRIKVRDSPTLHLIVGTEAMSDGQLKENIEKVMEEIKKALPAKVQIRSVILKKTMGKPVRLNIL